ncbi:MAG: PTS transporter subunit EIIC [Streptococcaceae bacterium]|jgi:PTS system cellobiose-specific IIC component|nr:PTS transporter subunit EIIC [Streptococcaceae bacterium]
MENAINKAMAVAGKISGNKYLKAVSNGLMATLPITIIGSIALLLAVLPVDFWQSFVSSVGIKSYLSVGYSVTVGVIAVYASFLIGWRLAKEHGNNSPVPAGIISLFSFLMMTPLLTIDKTTTLDMSKLGAQGLFTAIIVALVFTRLYCLFIDKKIIIKMPEGVPPFVSDMFAGLLPAIFTGFIAIIVSRLFALTPQGSFSDFVYHILALPLQHLSSSVWSLVFLVLVQMTLWFFGVHGSLVVGSFVTALYLPMDVQNMDAVTKGVSNGDLPNVLGYTFYNIFSGIGGAGGTLSLLIIILIFGKAKQSKTVANLAIVPGLFTVNEPVVFGLPLILNPITLIPFVLTPIVQTLVAWGAIASGIFPHLNGVQVPFGTPILINGFLAGGLLIAVLQVILVAIGCVIWFPFYMALDRQQRKQEVAEEPEAVGV